MPALLSLVTSVKDYIEIAHKLVETQGTNYFLGTNSGSLGAENFLGIRDYNEFGAVLTYVVLSIKEFLMNFLSFGWLNKIWSLPLIVPDVASAMISEISVLDSYFTNAFSFLENGLSTTLQSNANTIGMATDNLVALQKVNQNPVLFGFEKFVIGLLNSFFLFLPTSTAHLITLRRFVMQGVEAGFLAGLGTIAGNFLWLASIILGLRFIVIPWLSLDIFRYVLGFLLLVKYLWDSSKELNKTTKTNLDNNAKTQIFLLNFLLALTEQTSIYPFISNMSFGPEGSIIEGFSGTIFQSDSLFQFLGIHMCYLFGILLGSFSLLQFTVWFWENPAFSIYMWMISSYRVTTSSYYKVLNFVFLYLTMLCAISSIPYFGLDYTITNPLGFIPQDRMITQKSDPSTGGSEPILQETAFLGVKPTDKNSRIKEGVHARRERWKERLIKYQAFDASLYDQGVYDILTVEDLNYGFDRFWLRRKMRNHQIRFRLFPGPWMRSLKKQLNKPGFTGPRMEFFRILFEQYYHPSFHAIATKNKLQSKTILRTSGAQQLNLATKGVPVFAESKTQGEGISILATPRSGLTDRIDAVGALSRQTVTFQKQKGLVTEYSALRKFARNVNTRINTSLANLPTSTSLPDSQTKTIIYSKSLKSLFNKINKDLPNENLKTFRTLSKNLLIPKNQKDLQLDYTNWSSTNQGKLPVWLGREAATGKVAPASLGPHNTKTSINGSYKQLSIRKKLSKKERLLLLQKAQLNQTSLNGGLLPGTLSTSTGNIIPLNIAVQPLNYYFQKTEAFKRKLKYYSTISTRKFSVGNNAPYFKSLLKRSFFYYKPSLRLKRTLFTAALRRGFRKKSVMPKKLMYTTNSLTSNPSLFGANRGTPTAYSLPNLDNTNNLGSSYGTPSPGPNAQGTNLTLSTSQYSVLGKRASRYRYQIYKDVLQHWYYTPFNRLLLKFDVDSFMNRQPKAQFLSKNEERLLHLRRVLLAEHYNTLRWYTYMQHYRTMKSRIGGVKSLASSVYNQQFQGTFKKIRHLFAVTPSQATASGNLSVIKFDQPLFNESNQTKNLMSLNNVNITSAPASLGPHLKDSKKSKPAFEIQSPYNHEDLTKSGNGAAAKLSKDTNPQAVGQLNAKTWGPSGAGAQDLVDSSVAVTGAYILAREQLQQSQQPAFQSALWAEGPGKGVPPGEIINASSKTDLIKTYLNQKNYGAITNLLANPDSINSGSFSESKAQEALTNSSTSYLAQLDTQIILLDLLKQAKVRLNDQTFLKNYISHRIEKREQRTKATSKEVTSKLVYGPKAQLKNWLSPTVNLTSSSSKNPLVKQPSSKLTTGATKALNDGVIVLKQKTYDRISKSNNFKIGQLKTNTVINLDTNKQIEETLISLKDLNTTLNKLNQRPLRGPNANNSNRSSQSRQNIKSVMRKNIMISQNILNAILKPFFIAQNSILTKRNEKNLEWWRQKQRVVTKRKASRKKSRAKNIKQVYQKNQPNANNGEMLMQQAYTNWQSTYSEILNSPVNVSQDRERYGDQLNSSNLRQKQEETSETLLGKANKTFNKYFLLKFRKKASSKGRRYRNMSMSRGFAYVRKPKNVNSFTTISEYLENIESVIGPKTLNNINKMYSQDSVTQPLLSKEEKLSFLKDFKTKLTKQLITLDRKNKDQAGFVSKLFNNSAQDNQSQSMAELKNLLIQGQIKKSVNKKRSRRTWKKRKRQKFTKNHYKYRKRSIHGLGKLRVLAKKSKRIQVTQEFQHWWWNKYLPTIAQKQSQLNSQVVEGSTKTLNQSPLRGPDNLTFKPLSTTKALEIRANLAADSKLQSQSPLRYAYGIPGSGANNNYANFNKLDATQNLSQSAKSIVSTPTNVLDQIYNNFVDTTFNTQLDALMSQQSGTLNQMPLRGPTYSSNYNVTTTIPFYAGWDESLRKFVVTNRLLSRRDAGFEANINTIFGKVGRYAASGSKTLVDNTNVGRYAASGNKLDQLTREAPTANKQFTQAPLKGLNEASYLSLQTEMPFNSYIIDQFVPNNQSFYAPLGWSRFQFRHSLLNNWINKTKISSSGAVSAQTDGPQVLNSKTNYSFFVNSTNSNSTQNRFEYLNSKYNQDSSRDANSAQKLQNRRIKKRYALLKQSQMNLAYVPSGALLAETLPAHFISVFDKQYRMPRTRYIKRNLPKASLNTTVKDLTVLDYSRRVIGYQSQTQINNNNQETPSFTLRKRIKPKRKYHKKRFTKKDGLIFPRRRKFGSFEVGASGAYVAQSSSLSADQGAQINSTNALSNTNLNPQSVLDSNFRLRPSSRMNVDDLYRGRSAAQGTKTSSKALSQRAGGPLSKKSGTGAGRRPAKTNPTRLRQLRRREFQQVFKPLQRFQPRYGGFTWPGDYLRLETIPMPKLENTLNVLENSTNSIKSPQSIGATKQNQAKLKRKINVQPIGLLPRKYFLQKHNLKVFKKKLALKYMV